MKRTVLLFLLLAAAFDFLFWDQYPGLNVLLYTVLVITVLCFRYRASRGRIQVIVLACGSLLTAFMVMMYGAGWALTANIISLLLFSVAISGPQWRSAYYFVPQSLLSLATSPVTIGAKAARGSGEGNTNRRFVFYMLVVVVPLLIGAVFYAMYLWGSPHFREANSGFLDAIVNYLGDKPGAHVFFLIWAICMSGYFLFKGLVELPEESKLKQILRVRKRSSVLPTMGLKRELIAGMVLLLTLNILIAVVNYVDIRTVWFDFVVPENFSLKQFVHNGTWVLTVCVFMSVAIVLWLFRGNQNYFWKSSVLKLLAFVWIAQNMVLTFSVFMRNYHYIGWHGLAYGRIFVIVLMIMTFIALALLMLKLVRKYTGHYFFAVNSWIAYAFVIACSFVNWDRAIFEYNIRHANSAQIDFGFYLEMSPDLLPELVAHRAEIDQQIAAHDTNEVIWIHWTRDEYWTRVYVLRNRHVRDVVQRSWQSWTWADERALKPLNAMRDYH